jgi:hypothetical protein
MHAESLSNDLALAPATRHQHRLSPSAQAPVIGRLQKLFQWRLFRGRQPDPPHRFPLSRKPGREGTSKKMQGHPLHE